MVPDFIQQIRRAVIDGEEELTIDLTRQALTEGFEPMAIIDQGFVPAMREVGDLFENGDYFLPNLIISANSMQAAMQVLEPELQQRQQEVKAAAKVVIGTVQGDIHEIGKSLVGTMLAANGFQVIDLGVDVPAETFIAKIQESGAQLLGLSALLTTTMDVQREIIEALQQAGLRQQVKVMVGGAPVTRSWAEEIGADGFAEDAIQAVELAVRLANRS